MEEVDEELAGIMGYEASEARFHAGVIAMGRGDWPDAAEEFGAALTLRPDFGEAAANLGYVCEQLARPADAEAFYRQAIAVRPEIAEIHTNFAALLLAQRRLDEAEAAYRTSLVLQPDSPVAWSNLGVLLACRKQESEAEVSYQTALALDPDYRLAAFNYAYLLLRQGRWREGWARLEARQWYDCLDGGLSCPRWRGESLEGRRLLIGFEAGLGDMIQFARYAGVLRQRGASRVGIVCHPPLKRLFASLTGVDVVVAFDEDLPDADWDYWSPPLSLPHHCATQLETIPAVLPYLFADPTAVAQWAERLSGVSLPDSHRSPRRVGLVWRGSARFENDGERSLPGVATLAPLFAVRGIRFISLQQGAAENEAAAPPSGVILEQYADLLTDMAETAALVANLDLVISVDTAVAHLAGALGKACWILLPDYKTDWRWLTGRDDSPWYPGVVRLFRQASGGDWSAVIPAVRNALVAWLADARER